MVGRCALNHCAYLASVDEPEDAFNLFSLGLFKHNDGMSARVVGKHLTEERRRGTKQKSVSFEKLELLEALGLGGVATLASDGHISELEAIEELLS